MVLVVIMLVFGAGSGNEPIGYAAPKDSSGANVDGGPYEGLDDHNTFEGLHPAVQEKISVLRKKMKALGHRVYLTSGARTGMPSDSLHNQALAVDVTISGLSSPEVAHELIGLGFPCSIPYFLRKGVPCHMAHADLRNTKFADGPYAPGGAKALACPGMAVSRTGSCGNDKKGQWHYLPQAKPTQTKP